MRLGFLRKYREENSVNNLQVFRLYPQGKISEVFNKVFPVILTGFPHSLLNIFDHVCNLCGELFIGFHIVFNFIKGE